jgi:hypothetical protein
MESGFSSPLGGCHRKKTAAKQPPHMVINEEMTNSTTEESSFYVNLNVGLLENSSSAGTNNSAAKE